jgi:pimeloyl-ACP methyl ester carboxylesterase
VTRLAAALFCLACLAGPAIAKDSTGFELPSRPYTVDMAELKFEPLPGAKAVTGMTTHGSGYRLEIPANWNGELVVSVRGGAQYPADRLCDPQTHANCVLPSAGFPAIRKHLIERGFAWASPTFREYLITPKTRALDALDTVADIRKNQPGFKGRAFIIGNSLGGQTVQHALELFPGTFAGAIAGCTGDSKGYADFFEFTLAAMALVAPDSPEVAQFLKTAKWPLDPERLNALRAPVLAGLGPNFPYERNAKGDALVKIMEGLSGGPRPMFDTAFFAEVKDTIPGYIIRMSGVDAGDRAFIDNVWVDYRWESKPGQPLTVAEASLNLTIPRFSCDPEVCTSGRIAPDQTHNLGGIYRLTGKITVPLIELNALGDMIAFFSGAQRYAAQVEANGASNLLVQRAIRDRRHCGFNEAEVTEAFDDLIKWVDTSARPAGDDTRDPAKVAAPNYGCAFTRGAHDLDYDYDLVCRKQP